MLMVDLHTHSTHSDGSYTPQGLIEYAKKIGLTAIALTDHDVISGLEEAKTHAVRSGMAFIFGVELEVEYDTGEFHMLGLGLKKNLASLAAVLDDIQAERKKRNGYIMEKMRTAGIPITLHDIEKYAGGNIISRLHFARYLCDHGYTPSIDQAFARYLGMGQTFYVPKKVLTRTEAITLIRESGGRSIAAHPYTLGLSQPELQAFLLQCKEDGLDGIEAYHSDFPLERCRELDDFALSHGFMVTAGSDFHGENRNARKLGLSASGMEIPDRYALPFLEE
jgi:predicted metal-dependent phosphoesterase TrpH